MKYSLIEGNISIGSPTSGSEYAFSRLAGLGIAEALGGELVQGEKVEMGDIFCEKMKYAPAVVKKSREIYENGKKAIESGRIPITIGGDHSVAMGSVAASSACYGCENLSVVYVDGHTDINTEKSTITGYIHGMPLAAAMGICDDYLTVGNKINILPENIYLLGGRSIDDGEKKIIDENKICLYTASDMRKVGIEAVVRDVIKRIKTKYIHLSFDVDFMDEKAFASTGYLMPGGFTLDESEFILKSVYETGRVISMDLVEYNPLLDNNNRDAYRLIDLMKKVCEI